MAVLLNSGNTTITASLDLNGSGLVNLQSSFTENDTGYDMYISFLVMLTGLANDDAETLILNWTFDIDQVGPPPIVVYPNMGPYNKDGTVFNFASEYGLYFPAGSRCCVAAYSSDADDIDVDGSYFIIGVDRVDVNTVGLATPQNFDSAMADHKTENTIGEAIYKASKKIFRR